MQKEIGCAERVDLRRAAANERTRVWSEATTDWRGGLAQRARNGMKLGRRGPKLSSLVDQDGLCHRQGRDQRDMVLVQAPVLSVRLYEVLDAS